MSIRLTGKDALAEALCADLNPEILVSTKFYNEGNGMHFILDPHEALEMVEKRSLKPENLSCEALSVWEHLQRAVFFPIPGRETRNSSASFSDIFFNGSKVKEEKRFEISSTKLWMTSDFLEESPPFAITEAIRSAGTPIKSLCFG